MRPSLESAPDGHEFAIGVRIPVYLGSKLTVIIVLTIVQILLLVAVTFAIQPLGGATASEYLTIVSVLLACSWAAAGLAVSSMARSVDQATSFVPLLLIPQLLFAGAVIPYESMRAVAQALSAFVVARWGFASAGEAVDMNARLAQSPPDQQTFGETFFTVDPAVAITVIGLFIFGGLAVAAGLLARQHTRS